jgi:hypothetical protein
VSIVEQQTTGQAQVTHGSLQNPRAVRHRNTTLG